MAARALALVKGDMPSNAETRIILQAFETGRRETQETLTMVREGIAGLVADVKNLGTQVGELRDRVDKIDDSKAARGDLQALEARMDKTINEVKASSAFEAGRLSQEWTQRLDMIETQVDEVRADIKDLNMVRYKIMGACLLLGTISGAFFGWLFKMIH